MPEIRDEREAQEWLPFPSPGDLPDPGIEPGSPTLQANTLPSESPGKPLWKPRPPILVVGAVSTISHVGHWE